MSMWARPSGSGGSPARREAAASRSGMLRGCGQGERVGGGDPGSPAAAELLGDARGEIRLDRDRFGGGAGMKQAQTFRNRRIRQDDCLVAEQRLAEHPALHEIEILIADDTV